ncbi:platelet-activating factor acetylhydrolase IB subunit gamma-like [Anneissia japonica]|uniref:platelet-activating factor acetylhydrolase IB subunit gamma-like n=1 Tax=Anneissia japonica TaxID=1529436 RepID=UPI00142565DC|nr:platelet-activating factor acetylhydrolase IB subunit gamma-like [Anneissia japonica]
MIKMAGVGSENSAAVPVPVQDVQGDGRWRSVHDRYAAEAHEKEPDVLFIGDSLIQLLEQCPIWKELFIPLHCLNFGIGGDATQHVLWRIQNGELENIAPKVIVLLVGTNNHEHTADQVAGGVEAIVRYMSEKQPQANIVVMGVPPRGQKPNPLREKNAAVNNLIVQFLENIPRTEFFSTDVDYVHSDGLIDCRDMYDYLHFTINGYRKIGEPLRDRLVELLSQEDAES